MDKINKIITTMIILLVLMVVIICMLSFFVKQKEKMESENLLKESFNLNNKLEKISDISDYIFIKECINKYMNYSENVKYVTGEENVYIIEEAREQLKSIIPQFVIDELGIQDDELYEKLGITENAFRINNIYRSLQTVNTEAYEETTTIYAYYIDGILINKSNYEQEDFEILILLDKINETFLIIPERYIKNKNIAIREGMPIEVYKKESIENNMFNVFYMRDVSREDICQSYISDLKNDIMYDIKYVYNTLLDKEYKETKFKTIEEFEKYIKEKYNNVNKIGLNQYRVDQWDDYKEYICIDNEGNYFIFLEKSLMDYTLILDTYTVDLPEFTEKYASETEQVKVGMNIEKIFSAISENDYRYVYSKLDNTFRQNNFPTENILKEFIKNKFLEISEIEYLTYSQKANVNIYKIKINGEILNIIMQLGEGTEFTMSFSFEE